MGLIKTLPTLEGAKVIVIDEGADVTYAESLIAAWLPTWKTVGGRPIELMSFSDPKYSNKNRPNLFETHQVKVHDYYTLDVTQTEKDNAEKLSDILKRNVISPNSIVIIDSLSALVIYAGSLSEACRFVEKISTRVAQLVCIHQRDFSLHKIPGIKTLGTSYVRFERVLGTRLSSNLVYEVALTHRKPGGGILHQTELVEQNVTSYEIKSEKVSSNVIRKAPVTNSEGPEKIQASFRIEMNALEMKQRNSTPLPYTIPANQLNESKIHYEPDDVDDLDEEDPDDDLTF